MCNEFTKTFLEIDRDCIPTKEIIVRENDKPWFNNTLRKELRIHNRESDITKLKKQRSKVINM
jgi:hypothetical protein